MANRIENIANVSESRGSWTVNDIELATAGVWQRRPKDEWSATGLSIYAPSMCPGQIAVIRTETDLCGMALSALEKLSDTPACIITTDAQLITNTDIPVYIVPDGTQAILEMGRYARNKMSGNVIGVTGSSGKTTCVAMLAMALSPWGPACQSRFSANLPRGVAWNLASMPWNTPQVVVEMAIGRMDVSARMAQLHIAIVTNIHPAHLGEKSTLHDIARTKSAIFNGMQPGGTAILNRDMLEWDTVSQAAIQRKLTILTYGHAQDADCRLIKYDGSTRQVNAQIMGREISYRLSSSGEHHAINSLAVLATVHALGYPLEPAIEQLSAFNALAGRGEENSIVLNGLALTVIDDAYNANPGSMAAGIKRLSQQSCSGRKIAVLGEMAELGPASESYHTALAEIINESAIDKVYLIGELYHQCWALINDDKKGRYLKTPLECKTALLKELANNDTIMFKASNSTRLHQIVGWLKTQSTPQ